VRISSSGSRFRYSLLRVGRGKVVVGHGGTAVAVDVGVRVASIVGDAADVGPIVKVAVGSSSLSKFPAKEQAVIEIIKTRKKQELNRGS